MEQTANTTQDFNFHEFTDAIASMTELLDLETELLIQMRIKEMGELQSEKNELTKRLEVQQDFMKNNPAIFRSLSNTNVDQIRQYSERFNSSMQTYSDELYKASKVNETIVGMVVDAAKTQVQSQNTYQNFHMSNGASHSDYMPAIKFSEQI